MDNSDLAKEQYQILVDEVSPKSNVVANSIKAFVVGGAFCVLGQVFMNIFKSRGMDQDAAGAYTAISMVFLGVLLTGLGWYEKLGKHAGAGSAVPITGFANAMAAPAIEYRNEGLVLGMAAKMFSLAGPVIVYGTLTSVAVGLFHYFLK